MKAVKLRVTEVGGIPWPPLSRAIAHTQPQETAPMGARPPALTWPLSSDDANLECFVSEKAHAFAPQPTTTVRKQAAPSASKGLPAFKTEFLVLLALTCAESAYLGFRVAGDSRHPELPKAALESRTIGSSIAILAPTVTPAVVYVNEQGPAASAEPRTTAAEIPRREPSSNRPGDPAPVDPPGWVSLDLPIQVQVFERGRFVGTNDQGRLALSSGLHELELVNESLQFRVKQTVYIRPEQTVPLPIELPAGTLNVNALPWSDVVVDGRPLGATPLGHVRLSIGAHQIIFRHPQFGEQVRTAVVRAGVETRVTVDLRK